MLNEIKQKKSQACEKESWAWYSIWHKPVVADTKDKSQRTGGKVQVGFEGGQMPLQRRLPKVGFTSRKNINSVELKYDYLDKIAETDISIELLKKYKLINNKAKVKLIGPVTISSKKKLVDVITTKSVMEFIK